MSLLRKALDALDDEFANDPDDWLDILLKKLTDLVNQTENLELKTGGLEAIQILKDHENKIVDLGRKSLILFVEHVAAGDQNSAINEYYRSKASADEIIDSILDDSTLEDYFRRNADPDDIIDGILGDAKDMHEAYEELLALKREAIELFKSLARGARYLLPLLLSLL